MFAVEALEFVSLRALIARYVRSPLGHKELDTVEPLSDRVAIEDALAETAEAMEYVRVAAQPQKPGAGAAMRLSFLDLVDPSEAVARLRIEGASLDAIEIYELTRLLDLAAQARAVLLNTAERFPRLAVHGRAMADLGGLARELTGKILPGGIVADHASVALARLRREVEKQRGAIQSSLERFLRAHRQDGTLQEDFVTIRNDRFVVPVVTGRERSVDGVIHGASGSGHTLFVEPLETIALNNELVRLVEEELREVHRILREFTARLREHAPAIASSTKALARLDVLFAKAEFAGEFACTVPRLSPEGQRRLILRKARHPLLEDILRAQRKKVIPVSLELDEQQRTLLISGPNTGGKTVSLKTAGLLALMTHAGLPVPAEDAEFPLFDQVLADIGDHQSIAESLSTFSAHVMALRTMLELATGETLVLIDELGRATDPDEGGALGSAVLDVLSGRGTFTLASTHLVALKLYGATTPSVANASMGFDDETLEPTYVLRLGAPGKSAGLDIASRLGLNPALIANARSRMTNTEKDVAQFLNEMHHKLDALDQERREVETRSQELAKREQALTGDWEKKYAAKIRELEERAGHLTIEFEQRAEQTLGELSQKARVKVARTQREFKEAVEAIAPAPEKVAGPAKPQLVEGARVRLKGVRQPATVRRILSSGLIEVDAGFMKMQIAASDVEEILDAIAGAQKRPAVTFQQSAARPVEFSAFREINLIGQRAEEGIAAADKFLDNAALAEVTEVRIVHGHGMGILKRAIAELLSKHPHVEKFYQAPPEQGGAGATIVEMKV